MKWAWQKYYFRGVHPDGTKAELHVQKLRLGKPAEYADPASLGFERAPVGDIRKESQGGQSE
jgi:hypothetical protein